MVLLYYTLSSRQPTTARYISSLWLGITHRRHRKTCLSYFLYSKHHIYGQIEASFYCCFTLRLTPKTLPARNLTRLTLYPRSCEQSADKRSITLRLFNISCLLTGKGLRLDLACIIIFRPHKGISTEIFLFQTHFASFIFAGLFWLICLLFQPHPIPLDELDPMWLFMDIW